MKKIDRKVITKFVFAGFCSMLLFAGLHVDPAFGEDREVFLGVQSGYLYGATRYRISEYQGSSGFQSKLEFPLHTYLAASMSCTARKSARSNSENLSLSVSWMRINSEYLRILTEGMQSQYSYGGS